MSNLLASLGHTGRGRVVLGHTLNTQTVTKTKKSHSVLCKFMISCWATFTAILGQGLDTPECDYDANMKVIISISHRWGNWGTKILSNWITQGIYGRWWLLTRALCWGVSLWAVCNLHVFLELPSLGVRLSGTNWAAMGPCCLFFIEGFLFGSLPGTFQDEWSLFYSQFWESLWYIGLSFFPS